VLADVFKLDLSQTTEGLACVQDIAAAEEEVTRKGVTVAASRKSAAKLRRDVDKVAAELEALEQQEEAALERHEAAKAASFDHQEAMQVDDFESGSYHWSIQATCRSAG
jgi:phage shock protein A